MDRVVALYPNPVVDDRLVINRSGNSELLDVKIFSAHGRLIRSTILEQNISEKVLNFSDLAAGVYFIRIASSEGSVVKKIVLRR